MGVTYKLRDEVVQFIISQRQSNPLFSCRQLAESASQQFGLHLSKSSVHDVLKESGVITPRGRKPKNKFEIPQEKKKQIQVSLSQVKLLPDLVESEATIVKGFQLEPVILSVAKDLKEPKDSSASPQNDSAAPESDENPIEISPEYEGAGKIFSKAILWDLGIFSEGNITETDWSYYLTYAKGVKVDLENNNSFFIDLPLPLERCIRETADGLINNVKPLIVHKVSSEELFKASMNAQPGFEIHSISIVDEKYHILFEFDDLVEFKRNFLLENRIFVENNSDNIRKRLKEVFFSQIIDNNNFIENILNLKGFDTSNSDKNVVTLLINGTCDNKDAIQSAAERLNGMYLRDEQDRLVNVKIELSS